MSTLHKKFWTVSIIGGGPGLFCPHFQLVAVFCHFCWHCAHVRRKIWKTSTFDFMAGDIFLQYCWFILDVGGFGYLHLFGTYVIIFFSVFSGGFWLEFHWARANPWCPILWKYHKSNPSWHFSWTYWRKNDIWSGNLCLFNYDTTYSYLGSPQLF